MYLIETYPKETKAEFRTAVEDILTHLWDEPKKDWWHPFEVGELYCYNNRLFRVFDCIAGSVCAHIQVKANKGELDRAIMYVGKIYQKHSNKEIDAAHLVVRGKSIIFNPSEIGKVEE